MDDTSGPFIKTIASSGLWVAIYGPDGAGKSAVLHHLALELPPLFSGVRVYHLRIPLRRSVRPTAAVTDPHAQQPRGSFLSCLKLLYMLVHAWLTHLLVVLPAVGTGQLVLFDRYFHDYAIDPRRYRLPFRSAGLAGLLGRLAPRPHLQFVLDVPAEVLQARNSEVSPAESERQRQAYASPRGPLSGAVLVNADRPVSEVANEIAAMIRARAGAQSEPLAELDFARI